jgi:UDP-N-acetylmuramyl pentapeptide phosphotransferase/UDP-N-acetylglucosamine-1-phosphate transferase
MVTINSLLNNIDVQIGLSICISLFITLTAIPVIINISRLKDLMATIEQRSSHEELTPTLGGIAIFAATLITYFIWETPSESHELHLTFSALIILFFLGIKDDILILSPKKKLFIQIAASVLVITFSNLRIINLFGILNISYISFTYGLLLTIFIFITLINSLNLIDGIDGLAGMVGLLISSFFTYLFYRQHEYAYAILASALTGSLIGFLRYNWSVRNKIFMGDTGSLIVGFLISIFSIKYIYINSDYILNPQLDKNAPLFVVSLLMIPLFDTLRMFIIRLYEGRSPFVGDRKHFHHILIDLGFSHKKATMTLVLANLVFIAIFLIQFKLLSINYILLIEFSTFIVYCIVAKILSGKIDSENVDRLTFKKIDKLKRIKNNS